MERRSLRRQLATGLNAWRVYVNHFLAPDEPGYHDHPWPFAWSLVLWGSYTEEYLVDGTDGESRGDDHPLTEDGLPMRVLFVRRRRVRWFNWIPGSRQRYHRIAELHPSRFGGRGVVTLFFCGPLSGLNWGHWVPGRGHVDKAVYDAERAGRVGN
jgi:hypothetical protein